MNNQQQKPQTITLEYIARLKAEKREEIREQKKALSEEYLHHLHLPLLKEMR